MEEKKWDMGGRGRYLEKRREGEKQRISKSIGENILEKEKISGETGAGSQRNTGRAWSSEAHAQSSASLCTNQHPVKRHITLPPATLGKHSHCFPAKQTKAMYFYCKEKLVFT